MGELYAVPSEHPSTTDTLVRDLIDQRYRVKTRIAAGGMAKVYLAHDERLERPVALKIIDDDHATDVRFLRAFEQEAKAIAKLSHPNVVAVFDQGVHHGRPYVVMEYVAGMTLREVLNKRHRLSVSESLFVVDQVLAGLAEAHSAGLVHRDIKPENILVSGVDPQVVKVADFGLSRTIQDNTSMTCPDPVDGPLLATVAYVPPELVVSGITDTRSDVYSTGILLFELLTGGVPFDADEPIETAYQHVERTVPSVRSIRPELPVRINRVVLQATRRERSQRPADASEFARLLAEARSLSEVPEQSVRQKRLSVSSMPRPRQRKYSASARQRVPVPAVVAQLIVFALVLVLLGVGGWWMAEGRYASAPSLLDRPHHLASLYANERGFDVVSTGEEFSETIPVGLVLRQTPGPGEKILSGGTVFITVSKGPPS